MKHNPESIENTRFLVFSAVEFVALFLAKMAF